MTTQTPSTPVIHYSSDQPGRTCKRTEMVCSRFYSLHRLSATGLRCVSDYSIPDRSTNAPTCLASSSCHALAYTAACSLHCRFHDFFNNWRPQNFPHLDLQNPFFAQLFYSIRLDRRWRQMYFSIFWSVPKNWGATRFSQKLCSSVFAGQSIRMLFANDTALVVDCKQTHDTSTAAAKICSLSRRRISLHDWEQSALHATRSSQFLFDGQQKFCLRIVAEG